MIETFYGQGLLQTPKAFFAALMIGFAFGFILERAGFGSSRKLAGIFYFRDMTVLKTMFTALLTGLLGLTLSMHMGWINLEQIYLLPTVLGAQVVAGLIFGVGFVMGGWCPGTAAAGAASGKLDAIVFLAGAIGGSIVFNEIFPSIESLYSWGNSEVQFVYESVGMSRGAFIMLFTGIAVGSFWLAEGVEKKMVGGGQYLGSGFLKAFSLAFLVFAGAAFIFPGTTQASSGPSQDSPIAVTLLGSEQALMQSIEAAEDHIEPEELADRLMSPDPNILVVDVRTPREFAQFRIRGAVNLPLAELAGYLTPYKNRGLVVLYSNGMTHPAQARDSLFRQGYRNVYILSDGLSGFMERCLKPASIRNEPLSVEAAAKIGNWRRYFSAYATPVRMPAPAKAAPPDAAIPDAEIPKLLETHWLADNLVNAAVKIVDCRPQPEYNTNHIPGSLSISVESFRGIFMGVPSLLLPADMLARHFSLMGIEPTDTVILVSGDSPRDATMLAMAFERVGHRNFGILNGGFGKWVNEKRPVDSRLPDITTSNYAPPTEKDGFTVDYRQVLGYVKSGGAVLLDLRPKDYYTGAKSDEARAGHIPGAKNHPYTEDIQTIDGYVRLKPSSDLATSYSALVPSKDSIVVVYCRTGHQASQAYFVLTHILGYQNAFWYDGSWTEWAARPELPLE